MLNVSPEAAALIQDLVTEADLPAGAGLRIAQRDDHPALAMSLAEGPGEDDDTLVSGEVTVFLGPVAAERVQDQTLDAKATRTTHAFYLRD